LDYSSWITDLSAQSYGCRNGYKTDVSDVVSWKANRPSPPPQIQPKFRRAKIVKLTAKIIHVYCPGARTRGLEGLSPPSSEFSTDLASNATELSASGGFASRPHQ